MSSFKKLINKTSTKLASLGEEKASGVSEAGDGFPQTAAAAHSLPILTPGEGTSGSTSLPVECEASGTRKGKGASAMVLPTGQEKVALDARMWQKEKEMQTARAEILKPRALPDASVASRAVLSSYQRAPLYVPDRLAGNVVPVT